MTRSPETTNRHRELRAWLTPISAPSYTMPAVDLGKDWGTATVGTSWKLGRGFTALGAFTAEFGRHDSRTYGGQLGFNAAF